MTATTALTTLELTSNDFTEGARMPNALIYSGGGCSGDNLSPALHWSSVPSGTQSLVVTMYDPDAPTTVGFTHWILFDLDPALTMLAAGAGRAHHNPPGSMHGLNDFGERNYSGPCPPKGDPEHRYRISLYALDLPKLEGAGDTLTYPRLRFMIRDHILAKGMLMGRFGV